MKNLILFQKINEIKNRDDCVTWVKQLKIALKRILWQHTDTHLFYLIQNWISNKGIMFVKCTHPETHVHCHATSIRLIFFSSKTETFNHFDHIPRRQTLLCILTDSRVSHRKNEWFLLSSNQHIIFVFKQIYHRNNVPRRRRKRWNNRKTIRCVIKKNFWKAWRLRIMRNEIDHDYAVNHYYLLFVRKT